MYNKNTNNHNLQDSHHSVEYSDDSGKVLIPQNRSRNLRMLRSKSLVNLVSDAKKNDIMLLDSLPSKENVIKINSDNLFTTEGNQHKKGTQSRQTSNKRGWSTIVTIILVEARGLPYPPDDDSDHNIYCKFCLGSETFKSKYVPNTQHPKWRELIQMRLYNDHLLKISLWDKGKQKNFMGSCILDLSTLEKERTHEIWQQLDDGFGTIHLFVTLCMVRNTIASCSSFLEINDIQNKYSWYKNDWKIVGQLHVKVIKSRGLTGRPNAYCVIELDNARVQTHNINTSFEPTWNKNYMFNIYDITSTVDVELYDSSLIKSLRNESLGKVSIPLLRIYNGEVRWYALKDRNKRISAKGNCPRVLLEMSVVWNPVKASLRLFRPKEIKYIREPPKFDISLVHSNLEFVRDTFNYLFEINESFKRLFEWDNQEVSFAVLVFWLIFWYNFELWTAPLLLLIPFLYHRLFSRNQYVNSYVHNVEHNDKQIENEKNDKSIVSKIQSLQETTLTITNGIEYIASLTERLHNLITFKLSFLSYLTMIILIITSFTLYIIPFNYILMLLGIYKFTRKYLNPERILNNDLLDFISRIPDNEVLKDWKELKVPEPQRGNTSNKLARSRSN